MTNKTFLSDEQHQDDIAVDLFADAMKAKLAKKRIEGRSGWQSMSAEDLSKLLHKHIAKGDPLDVANIAMMLHQNGQSVLQSPEIQQRSWQPIETAPKDGTRYIGAYRYREVWFAEVVGDHSVSTCAGKLFPATHWMPLPEPPMESTMGK